MFDFLFRWFDHLTRSVVWQSFASHFQWVDWVTAVFVLIGLVMGFKNGMMEELGGIVEVAIVNFLVFEYAEFIEKLIRSHAAVIPANAAKGVSFMVLAPLAWFVISWISSLFKNLFHADVAPPLRHLGGMAFGVVRLLIFLSFFSQFLLLLPYEQVKRSYAKGQSYSGEYVAQLAPKLHEVMANPLHTLLGKDKSA
ncbi:MAG: CvpA family protein [Candidatus Omnitrophica bacterium]|nr:CvpA family protein [Candidatus Omnitrophota bacterium]